MFIHVISHKVIVRQLAAAAAFFAAWPAFAELPGLPTAQPPATEQVRPGEAHGPAPTMTGPVRGSLFKQGAVAVGNSEIAGQQGSDAQGRIGPSVSFTAVPVPQPHRYKKNDILTVVVSEDSSSISNGKSAADKTQDFDLALQQFLQLAVSGSGLPTVGTVNNPSSLPEIKFKYSNTRQSDADQERQDTLNARISATVVDVKPNGTLVIEAVKHIVVDKEEQTIKLSGICRVDDIAADNTLLSTQLADLSVSKQTKGQVHDVSNRGWLNKLIDQMSPF